MIITAQVALKQQENYACKQTRNWEKYPIRQLRRVERRINRVSKKGKTFLKYPSLLHPSVYEVLINNGYTIKEYGGYDYGWCEIYWKKTN